MPRQTPKELEEELQQQESDFYGDETISGSNPSPDSDDDVEEVMEEVVGEDFDETAPVNIEEEVEEDEEDLRDL